MPTLLIGMRRESARACTSSMDVGAGGATLEGNVDMRASGDDRRTIWVAGSIKQPGRTPSARPGNTEMPNWKRLAVGGWRLVKDRVFRHVAANLPPF